MVEIEGTLRQLGQLRREPQAISVGGAEMVDKVSLDTLFARRIALAKEKKIECSKWMWIPGLKWFRSIVAFDSSI